MNVFNVSINRVGINKFFSILNESEIKGVSNGRLIMKAKEAITIPKTEIEKYMNDYNQIRLKISDDNKDKDIKDKLQEAEETANNYLLDTIDVEMGGNLIEFAADLVKAHLDKGVTGIGNVEVAVGLLDSLENKEAINTKK